MKKSKIFSVMIALLLIFTMNMSNVKAAGNAKLYLSVVQEKSGIVTVSCKAENLDEITNIRVKIYYAKDKLHLEGASAGSGMTGFMNEINDHAVPGNVDAEKYGAVIAGYISATAKEVKGDIVSITFSTTDAFDLKDAGLSLELMEIANVGSDKKVTAEVTETQYTDNRNNNGNNGTDNPDTNGKIDIAKAQIAPIADQTYNKKAIRPGVTITYNGVVLEEAKDYALTYASNKKVGKATVTINGIGKYEGTTKASFCITPKAVKVKKATSGAKKKVALRWGKSKTADGYQIQVAKDKKFKKKVRKVNIRKNTRLKKTVKVKGKGRGKYYVRIRCYKIIDGQKHFGPYSARKAVRVK